MPIFAKSLVSVGINYWHASKSNPFELPAKWGQEQKSIILTNCFKFFMLNNNVILKLSSKRKCIMFLHFDIFN